MNRSQSCRKIPSEEEKEELREDKRATSHPNLSASLGSTELRPSKSSVDDLRRKVLRLNKELEDERIYVKQLRREKSVDLRHAKEEEQRRAASQQTELRSKLHKEKSNEFAALKEHMHKDKEKEILQIIKQKDDSFKAAQQTWLKEKEEIRVQIRTEVWNDAREETKKEFSRERTRLEQEIIDLQMLRKETEEALKIVQESDKRKADEIRRLFHEHEMDMEKLKRNSWQESRRQMAEIRQLLNIIEQLQRKLGLDSGHINKLRMDKENLYDELRRKTNTFDAWDSMMSTMKSDGDGSTPNADPKYNNNTSQELRVLQRKNVELSSLVKKLDEKNQQLATRNAELLSELDRNEKDARDKTKKLEKKTLELTQNIKKLESRNKSLLDEINSLKRKGGKDVPDKKYARPRGQAATSDSTEVTTLKEQIKDHAKTIEELKQNLMEKERRIDLLKERKKTGKKPKLGRSVIDAGLQPDQDDTASVVSDLSDQSEMSSNDSNSDANKLKKLTKELLALERAYAILQAQVGSTVDVERDELERQQLQSDLIESQARIHELERMMDSNLQGGTEELQQLQQDNQDLYQKLVTAETERDEAVKDLSSNTEDFKDLQDKKDLLEFELEEMSQLSYAGSEEEFVSRKLRDKEDKKMLLSLEEVKAYLEELETEKCNVLSDIQLEALRQARSSLTAMPQKISHLEATESVLRSKVKDLEERKEPTHRQYESHMVERDPFTDVSELENLTKNDSEDQNETDFILVDIDDRLRAKQLEDKDCVTELTNVMLCDMERIYENHLRDCQVEFRNESTNTDNISVHKVHNESMTDFVWADIIEVEETYREFLENMASLEGLKLEKPSVKMVDTETATDFSYHDILTLENMGRQLEELHETALKSTSVELCDQESNTDLIEKHEVECNTDDVETLTDLTWDAMDQERENHTILLQRVQELEKNLSTLADNKNEAEVMTDLTWDAMDQERENHTILLQRVQELEKNLSTLADNKNEAEVMTDLTWDAMDQERENHTILLQRVQELEKNLSTLADNKNEAEVMTDLTWDAMDQERENHTILLQRVQELEKNLSTLAGNKNEAEVMTDLTWDAMDQERENHTILLQRVQELEKNLSTLADNKNEAEVMTDLTWDAMDQERENHTILLQRVQELEKNLSTLADNKNEAEVMTELSWETVSEQEERYKEQINSLQNLLTVEKEMREADQQRLQDYDVLYQKLVGRLTVEMQDKTARVIVEKAISDALVGVANETIEESFLNKLDKMENLRIEQNEQTLIETKHQLFELNVEKKEMVEQAQLFRVQVNYLQKQLISEQELREFYEEKITEYETMHQQQSYQQDSALHEKVAKEIVLKAINDALVKFVNSTIDDLQEQLISEQELRETYEETIEGYETMHQQHLHQQGSLQQEKTAQEIVLKAINHALVKVVNSTINDLQEQLISEQELRETYEETIEGYETMHQQHLHQQGSLQQEKTAQEIVLKAINHALVKVVNSTINDLQEQLISEQELRETYEETIEGYETLHQQHLHQQGSSQQEKAAQEIVLKAINHALVKVVNSTIDDLQKQLIPELEKQQTEETKMEDKLPQQHLTKINSLMYEMVAQRIVMRVIGGALAEVANETIHDLQKQLAKEQQTREAEQIKLMETSSENDEVEVMTDLRCVDMENSYEQLMESVQLMTTQQVQVERCDTEIMTDMSWMEVLEVEEKYQEFRENIQEIQDKLAVVNVEKYDAEVMTDCTCDEMLEREQSYEQQIEDLQEELALEKMKLAEYEALIQEHLARISEDKCMMTDTVWIQDSREVLEMNMQEVVQRTINEAIVELVNEVLHETLKDDKEVMTEFSWKEIEYLEKSYREWVEELRLMKQDLQRTATEKRDKNCMTEAPCSTDAEVMTDLHCEQIVHLERSYHSQIEELQVLKRAKTDVEDKYMMTDLKWDDVVFLETTYTQRLEELEIIATSITQGERKEMVEKEMMTELSWEEIFSFEASYKEQLEKIEILEESLYQHGKELKDEETMTDLNWDEVECQLDTYKDQVNSLKDMLEEQKDHSPVEHIQSREVENVERSCMDELGWAFTQTMEDEVEVDDDILVENYQDVRKDAETMTDLNWEDILHVDKALTNEDRKFDKCCSTDVTWKCDVAIDIVVVEAKYDKECATDLSWDDLSNMEDIYWQEIQRLDELRDEQCKLVDKTCMTDSTLLDHVHIATDNKVSAECMTEISGSDIENFVQNRDQEHTTTNDKVLKAKENDMVGMLEPSNLARGSSMDFTFDESLEDSLTRDNTSRDLDEQCTSTDITLDDIAYFEDLEIKHHELMMKTKQRFSISVDKNGKPIKTNQETTTDITLADMIYYEQLEHDELVMEKKEQQSGIPYDVREHITLASSEDLLQVSPGNGVFRETCKLGLDQETSTELTLGDLEYLENVQLDNQELLMVKERWTDHSQASSGIDVCSHHALQADQETSTELTLGDLEYLENVQLDNQELLMVKERWTDHSQASSGIDVCSHHALQADQETSTELTLGDLEYLENIQLDNQELLMVKERWTDHSQASSGIDVCSHHALQASSGIDVCSHHALQADQETQTDFTINDFNYYDNLELECNELREESERHKAELIAQMIEKHDVKTLRDQEIATELTFEDLDYYENVELEYEDFKIESEQQIQLLVQQMSDREDNKPSEHKQVETQLTADDIQHLQQVDAKYRNQLLIQQELKSSRKNVNIETHLTMADLSRLEEVEAIHRECLDRQTRSMEQGVGTDVTLGRLQYLEEIESIHSKTRHKTSVDVGVGTDLTLAEIHYLEEIDIVHTDYCMTTSMNDTSSRTQSSEKESKAVSTDLTAPVLEYLEEVAVAHKEIVREYEAFRRSVTKDKEEFGVMTEMTGEHLDYLDEMALKSEELENMLIEVTEEAKLKQYEFEDKNKVLSKDCQLMTELSLCDITNLENELSSLRHQERQSRKSANLSRSGYECLLDIESRGLERRHDIALMTELTIDKLKTLENSDNIYMDLKERGILSKLEQLNKPMKEHSVLTDLLVTNIEHLEQIESLYNENERRKDGIKDKETETDMSQSDLTHLENLANKNQTNRDIEQQISVQSSEAVFGSCPRERRGRGGRYGNVGRQGDGGYHGDNSVDVGIQCELKDIISLLQEQQQIDGDLSDYQLYVSALKIKREHIEGFDPVEVVLRSGRNSSTPDVSTRDHGNKRYSFDKNNATSSASLNMDDGWQSTISLDSSGVENAPTKGSTIGRWDSPRVPLAQDEVFDLSDIDSVASEESLVTPLRKESAVAKFDRYVMARKESEMDLLTCLRDTADHTDGPAKTMSELLKENELQRIRIEELELLIKQKGDLSDEELQLLKQKIQKLQEAEQRLEELHDSNTALKDRINELQEDNLASGASTSRSGRDNWSDIDPSEGRTRLLLVQDWGLDDTDLESLFSARGGAVSPAESLETSALRRILDEYAKADHGTQAGPGPGVSQEIQTTGDLLKLIDLSYDGTIPDHIAKELEKLKTENKELYEELLELRRLKLENSKSRPSDGSSAARDPVEEPITSSVQTPSECQHDWISTLGVSDDGKAVRQQPQQPDIDVLLFKVPQPRPKGRQYSQGKVHESEIKSSTRDTKPDIDKGLRDLDAMDGNQPAGDILDFAFEQAVPPDFAPPPIPSEPPPDNEPSALDTTTDSVFDSSPPRDSRALRAASRQKSQPGRPVISESTIQPDERMSVESLPGQTEIPSVLRTSQTPVQTRPGPGMTRQPFTPRALPPPTLPKPRRSHGAPKPGLMATPLARSRESLTDEAAVGLTPRGYVRATASAINQGEIDALSEKINFLEKQLKNKDGVIRSMKTEATELENKALVERKEREIKILDDDVAFLKQENQKKERELLTKIGEINRKNYEVDQWKVEATNAEKQRKRIETSYMNLQTQSRNLQGSSTKLTDLQTKYSTIDKENKQLLDKVNKLEKTEKEFKQLEYNITVLQNHLQDMESVEKERDELSTRLKTVENQRDDLLKKGRMVESERNDFLRNNKIMEMQRDELEQRYAMAHEQLMNLKDTAGDMQHSIKEAQHSSIDAQHERNYLQTQYKKLESENIELQQQLNSITRDRNSLETRLAELEDRNREYLELEDGFHTLRLKAAELTNQRDDFETQIPTFKAKVTLLKKACKEKDEFIDKLNEEIRNLRHSIATSTLDDLAKIKSYGYSPENFVKYSSRRDRKSPQNVVDAKRPDAKTSPRVKAKVTFPKRCIALFDYNPQSASVSGQPEKELSLREGDHVNLLSDMDTNGCYEAELNGVRGLVPGLYVEDLEEGLGSIPNGTNHVTKGKTPVSNGNVEPDVISNGHDSMSPRSITTDLQTQCFVALFAYNPYQSCATGRPEMELPFKKGDIMTVYGDIDVNGYYKADMEGQTGLVPSNFVEEVSSSTFLQPTSSTAPQQILGMFENITSTQRSVPGSTFPLPTPPYSTREPVSTHPPTVGLVPSSHVVPPVFSTHPPSAGVMPSSHVPVLYTNPASSGVIPSSHVPVLYTNPASPGVIPSSHVVQPVATTTPRRDQSIQPIFTPYMTPAEVHKLAAPIVSPTSAKSRGTGSQRSPRQQGVTSKRSPSQPMTSPPRITSQVQKNSVQPVNKPKPRQSQALVSRPQAIGSRGPPSSPSNLQVLRPVNHDAILLGWTLPEMDEFGRSNGTVVKGYKIYGNGDHKMDVRSEFMAKALVDDLDLRYPIQFSVRTIGEGGTVSSEVSTTFTDTINNSRMSISKAIEGTVGNVDQCHTFVALYDYDPSTSSPNANPQYELKFSEGDILRVQDMSRKDGFYFGSLNGKKGLIPSNFIEEVAVAKVRGHPSPNRKHHDTSRPSPSLAITNGTNDTLSPSTRNKKKMIAMYDYNPKEQSPLKNSDSELSFNKGQIITVVGPMNQNGFYNAVIDGRKGLVPASFLESSLATS